MRTLDGARAAGGPTSRWTPRAIASFHGLAISAAWCSPSQDATSASAVASDVQTVATLRRRVASHRSANVTPTPSITRAPVDSVRAKIASRTLA